MRITETQNLSEIADERNDGKLVLYDIHTDADCETASDKFSHKFVVVFGKESPNNKGGLTDLAYGFDKDDKDYIRCEIIYTSDKAYQSPMMRDILDHHTKVVAYKNFKGAILGSESIANYDDYYKRCRYMEMEEREKRDKLLTEYFHNHPRAMAIVKNIVYYKAVSVTQCSVKK